MLDHLKDADHLEDACELLPGEITEAYMPDVYDTCYGFNVLSGMLKIIHDRSDDGAIASAAKPGSVFKKLLAMIPDEDKAKAVADFKEYFWQWADLYYQGLDKLLEETIRNNAVFSHMMKQVKAFEAAHLKPKKTTAPLSVVMPSASANFQMFMPG